MSNKKAYEVRYGRSDVTYTICAKNEDEAEEIDSEEIAIHLVDVGSPHSVSTTTSERRCLSVNLDKVLPNGTLCTEVTFNMGVECLFKT